MAYKTKGGAAGTVGRQSLQGATFGFADEAMDALGRSLAEAYVRLNPNLDMKGMPSFKETRQMSSQDMAQDWKDAPVTSFTSQAAGSIPLGLSKAAGNVANWASRGSGIGAAGKGAAVGAGYGGFSGLGTSEGDISDILSSGALGATIGGGLGAALSPVMRYAQSLGNVPNQSAVAKQSLKTVPKGVTKAQQMLAKELAMRPDIAEQLARAEALDAASKRVGIQLTLPEKIAQSEADMLLPRQAKVGSNPQTAGMMERFYASRSGTPTEAGQIENALMSKVRELSPDTQNYDDIAQALINKANQSSKDITEKLVSEASPLYEQAFTKSVGPDDLATIRSNPVADAYIKQAMGAGDPSLLGQVAGRGEGDIAVLDAAKKLIDKSMKGYGADSPANPRALSKAKDAILSMADKYAPEYKQARSIYSDQPDQLLMRQQIGNLADIDPMKAKQVGNQLFSGTQQNARMTAEALGEEGAKQAAAARVLNVMDTARGQPQTWANKIAPDQRTREMMDIYAGQGQFDDVLNVINQAKIGDRFRSNSVTDPLQEAGTALKDAASAGIDLATGNNIGVLRKALNMIGFSSPEDNPAFYQEMAELMTTDRGMDLLRQVAAGNRNAVQVLKQGSLMKRGSNAALPYLPGQTTIMQPTIGNMNAPMVQSQEVNTQAQGGPPPGFVIQDQSNALSQEPPPGFIIERRK